MRLAAIFRSRLGRRILLVFILCALVPVGLLATLSYHQVSSELRAGARDRLTDQAKTTGMVVVERLMFAEAELQAWAAALRMGTASARPRDLEGAFLAVQSLERVWPDGTRHMSFGDVGAVPVTTTDQRTFMDEGGAALVTRGYPPRVFMALRVDPADPGQGTLWAELDQTFLWGTAEVYASLAGNAGLCVLDQLYNPIRCSSDALAGAFGDGRSGEGVGGFFQWSDGADDHLAGYRDVYLRGAFRAPGWTVVVSEPKWDSLAPLAGFRSTFFLAVLAALAVVTLLSSVQIRRYLEPLAQLREGAEAVAGADFQRRVRIESGDEFQAVGNAFNQMAGQLGRHFDLLRAVGEIEGAALASDDRAEIVDTVLASALRTFGARGAGLFLPDRPGADRGTRWTLGPGQDVPVQETVALSEDERLAWTHLGKGDAWADTLPPVFGSCGLDTDGSRVVVLPMVRQQTLEGVLVLSGVSQDDVEAEHVRQVADHAALSLANVNLITELGDLQLGALTALARAVDAKSPWTAGHSERVTAIALEIARTLGLDDDELSRLRRGGLLHDVGKIGVPARVLDKPGRLTLDEWALMRQHPVIGVRILEPIAAFHDILPIVAQHHERLDGAGYPAGLVGAEIDRLARILTVADVFDAVTSERPYRSSMGLSTAVRMILDGAGTRFDPEVVRAFEAAVRRGDITEKDPSASRPAAPAEPMERAPARTTVGVTRADRRC